MSRKKIGETRGVRLQYRVCVCVHRSYHDLLLQLGKWSHEIANGLVHAHLHSLESRRGSLWCALFRIEPACPTTRRAFFEGCYLLDWPTARRNRHSPCWSAPPWRSWASWSSYRGPRADTRSSLAFWWCWRTRPRWIPSRSVHQSRSRGLREAEEEPYLKQSQCSESDRSHALATMSHDRM